MNILITNDDGINAQGIITLANTLAKENNIIVISPEWERSGSGHCTSLTTPLEYKEVDLIKGALCYSITGTPADCVKFGLTFLAKDKIDLVLSGINHGRNLGTDVLYSGTVGAAMEGLICGCCSAAISYAGSGGWNFEYAAMFIKNNIGNIMEYSSKKNVLNINFPPCDVSLIKGIKFTPLGREIYNDKYVIYENGNNKGYILKGYPRPTADNPPDCDITLNAQNYITVTPLTLDLTDYDKIKNSKGNFIL